MRRARKYLSHSAWVAICGVLAIALSSELEQVTAGSSEAKLAVTATVLKRTSLKILAEPAFVVVTAADIARGYVDVPSPAQLISVSSNTQDGYLLMFAPQGDFVRQTVVSGLGNDVQLGSEGGGVAQRPLGPGVQVATLGLGYRFVLSGTAQAGTYAWPMRVSVTSL